MKTKFKLPAILFLLAGIMLKTSMGFSQCINTVGTFPFPARYEVQAPTGNFLCVTTGSGTCPQTAGLLTMPGMGVNNNNPQYMLDILCTGNTNKDVNISCLTCTPVNSVGYRIDSNYVIWTNGDISSLYGGVGAGFGYANRVTSSNFYNTVVGFAAYENFDGVGGSGNIFLSKIC